MAIRLEGARRAVARVMQDACWIERATDERLRRLDEQTGELVDTNGYAIIFAGPCFIIPKQGRLVTEGGVERLVKGYVIHIPWDAPLPGYQDVVIPTASRYDAELVGRRLYVEEVEVTTVLVWRKLIVRNIK